MTKDPVGRAAESHARPAARTSSPPAMSGLGSKRPSRRALAVVMKTIIRPAIGSRAAPEAKAP
ncbi:hypothetical protein BGK72_34090 [Streptomyces agglomeratus]|nr:hypothetical protein BGK72_34090 [Streptomyces agglomeratus]